jgi:hypothetical protein
MDWLRLISQLMRALSYAVGDRARIWVAVADYQAMWSLFHQA